MGLSSISDVTQSSQPFVMFLTCSSKPAILFAFNDPVLLSSYLVNSLSASGMGKQVRFVFALTLIESLYFLAIVLPDYC